MKKKYTLFVPEEWLVLMIATIQDKEYEGLFWPNAAENQIDLMLEEDELLALMLKIPCRLKK